MSGFLEIVALVLCVVSFVLSRLGSMERSQTKELAFCAGVCMIVTAFVLTFLIMGGNLFWIPSCLLLLAGFITLFQTTFRMSEW